MLAASRATSRGPRCANDEQEQASLQLIVDDLLCGRTVSSVPKSLHPKLVPLLTTAKNRAITSGNRGLETKIDRIMKNLTLSPIRANNNNGNNQMKKKTKRNCPKNIYYIHKCKTAPVRRSRECYKAYDNDVDRILKGEQKYSEIKSESFTPIKICMRQRRDEASKSQDYNLANKIHQEYEKLTNYIRNIPKSPLEKHGGDLQSFEEYIEDLKIKYCEAFQAKKDIEDDFCIRRDELNQTDEKTLIATAAIFDEKTKDLDDEREKIMKCVEFRPSRRVMDLRGDERRFAGAFLYDEAGAALKSAENLENLEKTSFVKDHLIELRKKRIDVEEQKKRQLDAIEANSNDKHQKLERKEKKALQEADDAIESFAKRLREYQQEIPTEYDMLYYLYSADRSKAIRKNKSGKNKSGKNILNNSDSENDVIENENYGENYQNYGKNNRNNTENDNGSSGQPIECVTESYADEQSESNSANSPKNSKFNGKNSPKNNRNKQSPNNSLKKENNTVNSDKGNNNMGTSTNSKNEKEQINGNNNNNINKASKDDRIDINNNNNKKNSSFKPGNKRPNGVSIVYDNNSFKSDSWSMKSNDEGRHTPVRSAHSSTRPQIGTPRNSTSKALGEVKLTKIRSVKEEESKHLDDNKSSKTNEYEFVFENEEEDKNELRNPQQKPLNSKNSSKIQHAVNLIPGKSSDSKTKQSSNEIRPDNKDVTQTKEDQKDKIKDKENTIIEEQQNNKKDKKEQTETESIFLSDLLETDSESSEEIKKKRDSLSYKKFLSPEKVVEKPPRQHLCYDIYLRSPNSPISLHSSTNDKTEPESNGESYTETYFEEENESDYSYAGNEEEEEEEEEEVYKYNDNT